MSLLIPYLFDVEALLLVAKSEKGWGEAYNLGGAGVSLYDFVQKAIKINGRGKVKTVPFPNARKKIEVGDYIASYEKITKTYGWKPQVSLDAGIKKTFEYYRKYKKYYW